MAKSDIEAKNVQTYALHQGHVLSVRKKDIGIETILISREREREEDRNSLSCQSAGTRAEDLA